VKQLQRLRCGHYVISGALTLDTVSALRREGVRQFAADSGSLQLDLAAVTSADSGGLALLVDWLAWAGSVGRGLHYDHVPDALQALARISDVSDLIAGHAQVVS
jgi:phospholipid transport system transporter-binding protein